MTSRYIEHNEQLPELKKVARQIHDALYDGMRQVQEHVVHDMEVGSVYIGVEGVVLMEAYIAGLELYEKDGRDKLEKHAASLLARALSGDDHALVPIRSAARASFLETRVGSATLALVLLLHGDVTRNNVLESRTQECIRLLQGAVNTALEEAEDEDGCEVLYGRAGLLYSLLLIRKHVPPKGITGQLQALLADDVIVRLVEDIISRGKHGAAAFNRGLSSPAPAPALMWSWHGKRYLGGAHGVAGILQMLLSCPSNVIDPHIKDLVQTVEWLVGLQDREGNWPHKASSRSVYPDAHELVQWCHGAPAVLILISTLLRRRKASKTIAQAISADSRDEMFDVLEKGASLVYERGLLCKGVGLCHGTGGSVYALLAAAEGLAAVIGEGSAIVTKQTRRAAHLAALAAEWKKLAKEGNMTTPDRPWSLYEGLAGMCCAWAAVAHKISGSKTYAGFPGYDDLI